jgi:ketosteroid isomerase-like protein
MEGAAMYLRILMPIITLLAGWSVAAVGADAPAATPRVAEERIVAVLLDSVAGWNEGDLEKYMGAYRRSEDLRFASGGSVTFGWSTVLERYRQRYPDRAAMGDLAFSEIEVTLLGDEAALAFGRWELVRADDRPRGLFSLVLRRYPEGWRIIHDHTSSAD